MINQGLEGIVAAETRMSLVDGERGELIIAGYPIAELAPNATFEETVWLLWNRELPDAEELREFRDDLAARRGIAPEVVDLLRACAGNLVDSMDALRIAAGTISIGGGDARDVVAQFPTIVAAYWRLLHGHEPIAPRRDLGHAANYLYMLSGDVPDAERERALETYLNTVVDHGLNASTFTARVITSTGADLGSAVVGAIGALSGPLHGGAPSRALDMLDAIGTPENAEPWIRDAVEHGGRIMGFGHRVYKTDDPRSLMLRGVAERIGGDKVEFAKKIERTVVDVLAELKPGRQLYANVEFYAGVVMDRCGLPRDLFTPTFASSRVIGWCANVLEQAADNRIIRPSARYVGPPPPEPVPELR